MAELFSPAMAPFVIALAMMAAIAALEIAGLLFGATFSGLIDDLLPDMDVDADLDADAGGLAHALSWLGVGKAPLVIVLASFLGAFGAMGVVGQSLASTLFGAAAPVFIAAPLALLCALPTTGFIAGAVGRIMPQEETDAVSHDSFIGRTAEVIRGVATPGVPAEAKLTDRHGTTHYLLVEPDRSDASFSQGARVLLTEQTGAIFKAIAEDGGAHA